METRPVAVRLVVGFRLLGGGIPSMLGFSQGIPGEANW